VITAPAIYQLITFFRVFLETHVGKMENFSIRLTDYRFKAYCLVLQQISDQRIAVKKHNCICIHNNNQLHVSAIS
jgi:hypothetical protein